MKNKKSEKTARDEILNLVKDYHFHFHNQSNNFSKGQKIPYASRVYDQNELINLVDCSLDFWLSAGRYTDLFEKQFASYLTVNHCSLVNSGSSANLLAFMALTSPLLGDRSIQRGDEVITVAAGFPTTVSPIVQFGAIPVFVDITIPQYNIDCSKLEEALSSKSKAVMLAHTLGNPFDIETVKRFCQQYNLWLIEDNCDALGSQLTLQGKTILTGAIGDIGCSSFYPPHHITMGEGGAVYTNSEKLHTIIRSLRDWGRDCTCPSGKDNFCGRRFLRQDGLLPRGYDHKYTYSHFGYNLKATDMQAAVGVAQLIKLPDFVKKRKENWGYLRKNLSHLSNYFVLPEALQNSDPSWFGFMLTVNEDAGFSRNDVVKYLESKDIQTRMLFAGNLIKHPCFDEMRKTGQGYRVVGELTNTDKIMNDSFWIGVYPGMTSDMLDYMVNTIQYFINQHG